MDRMSQPAVLAKSGISTREAEVLAALGEHLSNAEIGATPVHLGAHRREPRVVAASQAGRQRPARAGRHGGADGASGGAADGAAASVTADLFVGRVRGAPRAGDALQAHRHVTAVGPGGVGKTRLALAVVDDLADQFPGGAWFVDLVPVGEPEMVGATIAAALGIGDRHEQSVEAAQRDIGHGQDVACPRQL